MNNEWSYFPLKGVTISSLLYSENDLIDQYNKEYKVISDIPDVYYNLQNQTTETNGLYKGCFLGKQKIIISSNKDFFAVYDELHSEIGSGTPVLKKESKPANFNIEIKKTITNQYYCDITSEQETFMLPSENNSMEFAQGATFAINGVENFRVWLDCAYTRDYILNNKLKDYFPPVINQYKIKSCNLIEEENKLWYPAKNWHSLINGVRVYMHESVTTQPVVNLIQDWHPLKSLKEIKNAYYIHPYQILKPFSKGRWQDETLGIEGEWNGKLGSFYKNYKLNEVNVRTVVKFY